jgi:hypothetical protein
MAEETPPVDEMNYEQLAQDAKRGIIRSALERAAMPEGIPGAHHFYVTFMTRAPGVSVPPDILAKYPDEMTVVLQHQYWDLKVEPTRFSVMLKFGGMPKVLAMPYTAVTRFYDPSVMTTARRSCHWTSSGRSRVFPSVPLPLVSVST